ncbi:uncharacterized protein BJ171DRAFT_456066 [Polychytrium aggregatum]|uniref:uncharacterized protein n=1 Tax=Polychytrium aggregatum TaxID=110093 RepID=UPI0022FEEAD7|nr:uncharacterized protein BJ171DRAFT_456066 [Polychytrium aggregatum]KAI9207452.1 hypothetical protein BJ171DRAFT_456066 [Polychytrium aggregatum]
MPGESKKGERRVHNMVHDDAIWRQTIHYELTTASNWEGSWGFMKDAYRQPSPDTKSDSRPDPPRAADTNPPVPSTSSSASFASGLPSKVPQGLTDNPDSIVSNWLCNHNVPRIIRYRMPIEKYRFPATTATEIGWLWGKGDVVPVAPSPYWITQSREAPKNHTLERFGKHAKGRVDTLKWWGGGRESLP